MKSPILLSCLLFAPLLSNASAADSNVGRRFPSEKTSYIDAVTGVPVTVLTTSPANDQRIYQTHPQWTFDDKYLIFRSNRDSLGRAPTTPPAPALAATTSAGGAPAGRGRGAAPAPAGPPMQIFAVNEVTGDIIQLTDDPGVNSGTINVSRLTNKLYYLNRGGDRIRMIELDLAKLLADSEAGTSAGQPKGAYERVVTTLPDGMRDSGGFTLDADEKHAYMGVRGGDVGKHLPPGTEILAADPNSGRGLGAGPGGIRSIDLATGEIKVVIDTPFQMGHVQSNYWNPGEIVYCHETGGDAPQRMWTVMADGSGNRPLFPEGPTDWVTHEAVITKDEVVFNILGHQNRLRASPTGIAIINLRTNFVELLGQVDESGQGGRNAGGLWHCNGSSDGRWVAGDTFRGNIWLIDRRSGEKFLLTTDHKMQPDHAHPYFSRDSKRVLLQSGHLSGGTHLDLLVVTIPAYLQNRR